MGTAKGEEHYKLLRFYGHVVAAIAVVSFARGLVLYREELSSVKTGCFACILFGWFVAMPLTKMYYENEGGRSEVMQTLLDFQSLLIRRVFPWVIISAFVWMTFTSWKRADREVGVGQA